MVYSSRHSRSAHVLHNALIPWPHEACNCAMSIRGLRLEILTQCSAHHVDQGESNSPIQHKEEAVNRDTGGRGQAPFMMCPLSRVSADASEEHRGVHAY